MAGQTDAGDPTGSGPDAGQTQPYWSDESLPLLVQLLDEYLADL